MLIMSVGTYLDGVYSEIAYLLAFIIPVTASEVYSRADKLERERISGVAIQYRTYFGIKREGLLLVLPAVIPSVVIIALTSALSSLVFPDFGNTSVPISDGSLFSLLISLALVPAIAEELLFRYVSMKILVPRSPRAAIIISALLFGFFHTDPRQIPYAILAGVIFMTVDIMADSILPSIFMHFINNSLSLTLMRYRAEASVTVTVYTVLAVLLALSVVFLTLRGGKYKRAVISAFDKGIEYTYDPSVFALALVSTLYFFISFLENRM